MTINDDECLSPTPVLRFRAPTTRSRACARACGGQPPGTARPSCGRIEDGWLSPPRAGVRTRVRWSSRLACTCVRLRTIAESSVRSISPRTFGAIAGPSGRRIHATGRQLHPRRPHRHPPPPQANAMQQCSGRPARLRLNARRGDRQLAAPKWATLRLRARELLSSPRSSPRLATAGARHRALQS